MTHPKLATPNYPIHELLINRWSPRAFADTPVEREKILSLLEAARWAASSSNLQPWSFIVAPREDEVAFSRAVDTLMAGNVPWASKAPLLMISVAHMINPHRNAPHAYAWHDVGLAVQNMIIQATAMGLYVHQMGGFDKEKARANFNIPENFAPVAAIAVGYLGNPDDLPEDRRSGETAPRERKPLSEFVFGRQWGQVSPLLEP